MNNIELDSIQQYAFDILCSGKNVFLTGQAGTGKTLIINKFKEWCSTMDKKISLTATTGVASVLIGGTTLHSWAGIGIDAVETKLGDVIKKIKMYHKSVNWETTDILVIDEISMLDGNLFDRLNIIGKRIRKNILPFGGIQIVLVGDFLQLGNPNKDGKSILCFDSETWKECFECKKDQITFYFGKDIKDNKKDNKKSNVNGEIIYLKHIHRQSDDIFKDILAEIRVGRCTKKNIEILKTRLGVGKFKKTKSSIRPTKLFAHRKTVDYVNEREFKKLLKKGVKTKEYLAIIDIKHEGKNMVLSKENEERLRNDMIKNSPVKSNIKLAVGAQVMLLSNNLKEIGLVNGSRGIITNLDNKFPMVKFRNNMEVEIEYNKWEIRTGINDSITVIEKQIPLCLAYAITIHKIQGATLDCVRADLGDRIFEYGQAYVTLSRVRRLEDLELYDFNPNKIKANPKIVEFYDKLENK
jgi:ATP-dependent DNA helicase PIF1